MISIIYTYVCLPSHLGAATCALECQKKMVVVGIPRQAGVTAQPCNRKLKHISLLSQPSSECRRGVMLVGVAWAPTRSLHCSQPSYMHTYIHTYLGMYVCMLLADRMCDHPSNETVNPSGSRVSCLQCRGGSGNPLWASTARARIQSLRMSQHG